MTEDAEIEHPVAAMIAIGDELLSGRTKDKNIAHLAKFLDIKGIELQEVRIIADKENAIIAAIHALRKSHQYVFTCGGIGPTHDDITCDAVAAAFGVEVDYHAEAFSLLKKHYATRNIDFTLARKKMARIPVGATLIDNAVSVAPGFRLENVFVLAGVPCVFNAMLQALEPELTGTRAMLNFTIDSMLGEGTFGEALGEIATNHPSVSIGSYPRFNDNAYSTQIVIRSHIEEAAMAAIADIKQMLANHQDNINLS